MQKIVRVFVLLSLVFACGNALGQVVCDQNIQYEVRKSDIIENGYAIYLSSISSVDSKEIKLFDLLAGKVVDSRAAFSINPSKSKIFDKIASGTYTIIIDIPGCRSRSIGGITGIRLSEKASSN